MPQSSIYYAVGRLSVMEKNALDQSKLERLLLSQDAREARRILSEFGWPDGDNDEANAARHVTAACLTLKDLTTDESTLNAFLVRFDVANLKSLLKARAQGMEGVALSPCGTVAPEKLRHAVQEHQYDALPRALKDALNALEKRMAVQVDPMDIDMTLDKAHYELALSLVSGKQKTARRYFLDRIDTLNGMMCLRAMHRQKTPQLVRAMLLEGGRIRVGQWEKAYAKPETLPLLLNGISPKVYQAAIAAHIDQEKLPWLEKVCADHLTALFTPYRRSLTRDERIIGHLFLREREAAAVRLILAGKENGFAPDTIRERLRDLYV